MRQQMKAMTDETFHLVQQNAIFGAIGMVLFTGLVFYFSSIWKPRQAVLFALGIYIVFMVIGKPIMAMLQS